MWSELNILLSYNFRADGNCLTSRHLLDTCDSRNIIKTSCKNIYTPQSKNESDFFAKIANVKIKGLPLIKVSHHKQPQQTLYNKILRDSKHLIPLHFHSHGVCILMSNLKWQYLILCRHFACLRKKERKLPKNTWVSESIFSLRERYFNKRYVEINLLFYFGTTWCVWGCGSHSKRGNSTCTGILFSSVRLPTCRWRWFLSLCH